MFTQQLATSGKPSFSVFEDGYEGVSSVGLLNPALTINGITAYPVFRYNGGDANSSNWSPWKYGESLALQAGTAPTYNAGSPLLGLKDDSVEFNAGGYYRAGNNTFADLTTEDFVIEIVYKHKSGNQYIFGKGTNPGFRLRTGTGTAYVNVNGSSNIPMGGLVDGCWYHLIWFVDRSGSGICYRNGTSAGSAIIVSAHSATASTANPLNVGDNGGFPYPGSISYVAMWQQSSWLDTHLQPDIAKERFAKLTGIWPQRSLGTKIYTSGTRDSVALLEKSEGTATQPSMLIDGDMEAVDTSAWAEGTYATLSKEPGTRTGGSGTTVLRLTNTDAVQLALATQTVLISGDKCRVTGWGRGDGGVQRPTIRNSSGITRWSGSTSTDWQYFDITFSAYTAVFYLATFTGGIGGWVEFDDVTVEALPKQRLYKVGAGWMRNASKLCSSGNRIRGFLSEQETENLCLYSTSFGSGAWFPIDPDDGILPDADMEAGDTASWTAANNAVLTKESNPRTGSVGSQCLRVAYSDTSLPRAAQTILTLNSTYRITGWCRGDGSGAYPAIYNGGINLFNGTTSVSWQYFDFTFVAESTSNLYLYAFGSSSPGEYSEWDDILIYPLSEAPNKEEEAVSLIGSATDGEHGLTQSIDLTADLYTFSVWAKRGNQSYLYLSDDTVANAYAYFELRGWGNTNLAGAGCVAHIEHVGDNWVRCGITFTGTAATHTFKLQSAQANNDKIFTGNSSTNTQVWGAQVELSEHPTSYILTEGSSETRNADVLYYKGDDGNLGGVGSDQVGTVVMDVLMNEFNLATSDVYRPFTLNDGGASSDRIYAYINSVNRMVAGSSASAGFAGQSTVGAGDVADGEKHELRVTWETNNLTGYDDGVAASPDTTVTIPDDLDRIYVGTDESETKQINGIISNFKIWPFITLKS